MLQHWVLLERLGHCTKCTGALLSNITKVIRVRCVQSWARSSLHSNIWFMGMDNWLSRCGSLGPSPTSKSYKYFPSWVLGKILFGVLTFHFSHLGFLDHSCCKEKMFGRAYWFLYKWKRESSSTDIIGLDWTVDMADGRRRLGSDVSVQGNVDPAYLFSPLPALTEEIQR